MAPSHDAPRSSCPCDTDHLLRALANNRTAACKLVKMFLDMYPGKAALLAQALHDKDWAGLRQVVHDLRGSCAMFSASTCLALAGKLENALPNHVDGNLLEVCAHFRKALDELFEHLRQFYEVQSEFCQ